MGRITDIMDMYYGTLRHYFTGYQSDGWKNAFYGILRGWWPYEDRSFLTCLMIIFLISACISVISVIVAKRNRRKGIQVVSAISLIINACAILSMVLSVILVAVFWDQIVVRLQYTRGLVGTFYVASFWVTLICLLPSVLFILINIILCIIGSIHKNAAPMRENVFAFSCPRCGKPVSADSKFCQSCGQKINRP